MLQKKSGKVLTFSHEKPENVRDSFYKPAQHPNPASEIFLKFNIIVFTIIFYDLFLVYLQSPYWMF